MSEGSSSSPLLAVLLVTSSSRGASLSFRFPRRPVLEKRYSRVKYLVAAAEDEEGAREEAKRHAETGGRKGRHDTTPSRSRLASHSSARNRVGSEGALASVGEDIRDTRGWEQDEMDDQFDQSSSDLSEDSGDASSSESSDSSVSEYAGAGEEDERARDLGSVTGGNDAASRLNSEDASASVREGLSMKGGDAKAAAEQNDVHAHEAASSVSGTAATKDTSANMAAEQKMRRLRAYQQYLGYSTDVLASMLAPKRELCHQKFELVIDDLAFVGHPVCVDKNGIWDSESESAQASRGRGGDQRQSNLREAQGYDIDDEGEDPQDRNRDSSDSTGTAPMTLFHLVLVLDRPDPSPFAPSLDLTSWLQIFYDNIAFKMTAALFAEEVRCRYVSQEAERIGQLRERCVDDGQSYKTFMRQALLTSSLARSLQQVYASVVASSHAFVSINDTIDAHLQLPKILQDPARMAHIADVDAPIDVNDPIYQRQDSLLGPATAEEVMYEEWNRTTGPFLLPWKTLLLLHDDHSRVEHAFGTELGEDELDANGQGVESWARRFTSLLTPTLDGIPTLADMADLLDWRLEEDVYPMVRHLIYYREARVVDVPRIQNYYAVSPLFDFVNLARFSMSWDLRFPGLPPLAAFLASLSSSLRPFSTLLGRRDQRQTCLDVLIWLLRHDVVVQMHVRLRLVATEACQRRAAETRRTAREQMQARKAQREAKASGKGQSSGDVILNDRPAPATSEKSLGAPTEEPPVSALTATRPDEPGAVPSSVASSKIRKSSPERSPTSQRSSDAVHGSRSRATSTAGLIFERRQVLRSRSPSSAFGMQHAGANLLGSSVGAHTSGSSRPSTPLHGRRRRGSTLLQNGSDEARAAQLRGSVRDGSNSSGASRHPNIALAAGAAQALTSVSLSSHAQSLQREGRSTSSSQAQGSEKRHRSPSRPRMRVTGFGIDEEVSYQSEESREASRTQSAEKADASAVDGDETVPADELRRMALKESSEPRLDPAASAHDQPEAAAEQESNTNEAKDEKRGDTTATEPYEDDDDDLLLDHSIEVEAWETQPVEALIAEPSRASGEENEWIAAMAETRDAWLVERLFKLLPFLNGKHTVDEIVYRLEWRRKELRAVLSAFSDEILTLVHP